MSDSLSTLSELSATVIENYGSEEQYNGCAFILWNADNSIGVAYAGTELQGLQVLDLTLNGARALVSMTSSQMNADAQKAEASSDGYKDISTNVEPLRVIQSETVEE